MLVTKKWLEVDDLMWDIDSNTAATAAAAAGNPTSAALAAVAAAVANNPSGAARTRIVSEIDFLRQYMEDDRDRYLAEIDMQADGLPGYFLAFIGASQERHPWTVELVNCAMAISHVIYMHLKGTFKRVRPSLLCPGLVPPFGPPAHPAFPSGHATLGHLAALLLLEIQPLYERYGIFQYVPPSTTPSTTQTGTAVTYSANSNALTGQSRIESPLLWLASRVAQNRERLGVHYPSDSFGGRHLAAAVVQAMRHPKPGDVPIHCPTLDMVLRHAAAEWTGPI